MIVWRTSKADLKGDGVIFGIASCGIHVVVETMFFPLVVCVFSWERVENNWLVEEEAPNWI